MEDRAVACMAGRRVHDLWRPRARARALSRDAELPYVNWAGVDGGGTKSRAMVIGERGRELAVAEGPAGLVDPLDPAAAAAVVAALVRQAALAAGVPLPLEGLWAGLAGVGQEGARRAVQAALGGAGVARRTAVGTDVEAARADAFGDGPGVLLVAGTGSVVLALDPSGAQVVVGGWGALLDDEGSGFRIGLEGLRAVVASADGRAPETELARTLAEATGVRSPADLPAWAAAAAKRDVAALAMPVFRASRAGDAAAVRVVGRAVEGLRALLGAALARTSGWQGPPPVALSGGLVDEDGELREAVAAVATELGYQVRPVSVVPERGAALKALRLGCRP